MRYTCWVFALVALAGCSAEREFWTRSSTVPIDYYVPIDVQDLEHQPKDRDLPGRVDLDAVVRASVELFSEERGRSLRPADVVVVRDGAVVVEPDDRELRFCFRVGKPRLAWCGDDYCLVVHVAEWTSCPRGDVPYPLYFRRCLLGYLEELARQAVAKGGK